MGYGGGAPSNILVAKHSRRSGAEPQMIQSHQPVWSRHEEPNLSESSLFNQTDKCPAFRKVYQNCSKKNHFADVCMHKDGGKILYTEQMRESIGSEQPSQTSAMIVEMDQFQSASISATEWDLF